MNHHEKVHEGLNVHRLSKRTKEAIPRHEAFERLSLHAALGAWLVSLAVAVPDEVDVGSVTVAPAEVDVVEGTVTVSDGTTVVVTEVEELLSDVPTTVPEGFKVTLPVAETPPVTVVPVIGMGSVTRVEDNEVADDEAASELVAPTIWNWGLALPESPNTLP